MPKSPSFDRSCDEPGISAWQRQLIGGHESGAMLPCHSDVSTLELLVPDAEAIGVGAAAGGAILAAPGTTDFSDDPHPRTAEVGPISSKADVYGRFAQAANSGEGAEPRLPQPDAHERLRAS